MNKKYLSVIPFICALTVAGINLTNQNQVPTSSVSAATKNALATIKSFEENALIKEQKLQSQVKSIVSIDESAFWVTLGKSYEWLIKQDNPKRFAFLYNATIAAQTSGQRERLNALGRWLNNETRRFEYEFSNINQKLDWAEHISALSLQIEALTSDALKKSNAAAEVNKNQHKELIKSLAAIRAQLLEINPPAPTTTEPLHTATVILVGLLGSLLAYYVSPRRKEEKEDVKNTIAEESLTTVNPVMKVFDLMNKEEKNSLVDLESLCHQSFKNLNHLFVASGLGIHSSPQVPSNYRLNVDKHKMMDAIDAFVKGTVVLAQNCNKPEQDLQLQWSCKTTNERAIFEIDILGKEFNTNELRQNHQMNRANSVVSQFARAERHLENFRPSIRVMAKNGKTQVELSLEINPQAQAVLTM